MKLLQSLISLFEIGDSKQKLNWIQSSSTEQYTTFSNNDETFGIFVEQIDLHNFQLPEELERFINLNVYSVIFGSIDSSGNVNLKATKSNRKPIVTLSIVRNGLFEKLNKGADVIIFAAKSQYDDPQTYQSRVSLYTALTMAYAKYGYVFKKWNDSKGTYFLLIRNSVFEQMSDKQIVLMKSQVVDRLTIVDKLKRLM